MKMMIRAALVAALLAVSAPASAAIAIIPGTGTNGALGVAGNTGSSTIVVTTTADVPHGSLIVITPSARQSLTWTGCTDSAANTYTFAFTNTLISSQAVRQAYSLTANDLLSGGTITCTANTSSGQKGAIAVAFSGVAASPLDSAGIAATGTNSAFNVGPSGTLSYPGGTNEEVLVGGVTWLTNGTQTDDPSFINLGVVNGSGTVGSILSGYKIVSNNSPITWMPSSTISSTFAGNLGAYKGVGGPAPSGTRRLLMGVGQ